MHVQLLRYSVHWEKQSMYSTTKFFWMCLCPTCVTGFWMGPLCLCFGKSPPHQKNNKYQVPSLLGFPGSSVVKNPPAIQETQLQSLGWEDLLEDGMVTHSSTLAWGIPWTEKPGGLQSMGSQRVRHDQSDLALTCTLASKARCYTT